MSDFTPRRRGAPAGKMCDGSLGIMSVGSADESWKGRGDQRVRRRAAFRDVKRNVECWGDPSRFLFRGTGTAQNGPKSSVRGSGFRCQVFLNRRMAMDVRLVVANGKFSGKSIRVTGPKFFIGRGEDCNVRPASDLVSRHHCVLILDGDYLAVRDLGSKNGTFVNGQRVRGETPLKDGDHLLIGVLEFVVRTGAEAAKVKPKVETVQEAVARTASASSTEFDVDQWLSEDEVGPESPASAETKTIQVDPAQVARSEQPAPHTTPEKPVDEQTRKALANLFSDEENKEEPAPGAKKEGDSGKFQKPQAADTRQAAANVLKSLFRRT